jgi:excisionase family DNA binding protein
MSGDIASLIAEHRGGMSVRKVAELTSIAPKTLYAMAKANRVPAVKIGAKVIFDPAKLAAWWRSKESA